MGKFKLKNNVIKISEHFHTFSPNCHFSEHNEWYLESVYNRQVWNFNKKNIMQRLKYKKQTNKTIFFQIFLEICGLTLHID